MEIRHLTTADVPAALELVKQAGWNQVSADWHRLLDLEPDGCFGGYVDGDLVATTTLCTYDGSEHKSAECGNGPVLTDTAVVVCVLGRPIIHLGLIEGHVIVFNERLEQSVLRR